MADALLNIFEAADVLNCSVATVRRKIGDGTWPCTRITRRITFSEADIAAIVAMSQQPAKRSPARPSPARPRKAS